MTALRAAFAKGLAQLRAAARDGGRRRRAAAPARPGRSRRQGSDRDGAARRSDRSRRGRCARASAMTAACWRASMSPSRPAGRARWRGSPMPSELRNRASRDRDRGRGVGRRGAAARRALAPAPGRHRRAAARRSARSRCCSGAYYLDKAPEPLQRGARRRRSTTLLKGDIAVLALPDAAPAGADREGRDGQMDGEWRHACCASPVRISPTRRRRSAAGDVAPRRPHAGRRAVLGDAGASRAVRPDEPLRRARRFRETSPCRARCWPSRRSISPRKTWARLTDGTPLVTAEKRGKGWLVLVHTTADPEWSNLAHLRPLRRHAAPHRRD